MPRPDWHKRQRCIVGRLVVLADEAAERRADADAAGFGVELGQARLGCRARAIWPSHGLNGARPFASTRGFVHEAGVDGADPAVRILGRLLDELARALARQIVEHGEHAVVRLVGRDRRVLRPGAVGNRRNRRPGWTLGSMPAVSKPKVPICGLGSRRDSAPGATSATGATSTGGAVRVAHPASAVAAASNTIIRAISNPPSAKALKPQSDADGVAAISWRPPAPSDKRHPISGKRHHGTNDAQARDHAGAASDNSQASHRQTLAWVVASTLKVDRSA